MPSDPSADERPPAWKLVLAFGALYLIWGSTYLAIRFAIETLPPFTMAGVRFAVAGSVLYLWTWRVRGVPHPDRRAWRAGTAVGALLLLGGNGGVVWAEQYVPSGLVALLVATVPIWMVLLDWLSGGERPGPFVVFGLLWGFGGVALLMSGGEIGATTPRALLGGLAVLAGSLSWAVGSLYSRTAALPRTRAGAPAPRMATAVQMLTGGSLLLLLGLLTGEAARIDPGGVSLRSALALAYLVVFGSLVAFSAYIWLLRHASAARVSTYAYVNPLVALLLGWALADEPLGPRTLVAAAVILSAVALITVRGGVRRGGSRTSRA